MLANASRQHRRKFRHPWVPQTGMSQGTAGHTDARQSGEMQGPVTRPAGEHAGRRVLVLFAGYHTIL